MKKLWKKVRRASPGRSRDSSPKGSTRGSVSSLNIGYEVREKDLGKLHKAAWIGDLNKVKQLAKKDPSPLDKENRTPLHLACVQGHDQVVQELLEWKAKTNVGDNQSRTPLMRAVEFQQEGCVQLLTSFRADVETSDSQGNTSLHLAVAGGSLAIISLLVKAGATLNTRNKEGFAPLHLAVRNKMEDVCRLLLKERADIDVEDTNLRTPLMYACQDGSVSLVRLLLNCNANTQHKDSKGWSADDYAVIPGHHACSQLITDHNLKMNRATPVNTPRSVSSLPPSLAATPRDKDSIGLPIQDGGDDDSDNETISKASGGPDSWADSPEISMADKKDSSDVEDNILDQQAGGAKVDVTKFAHAIHISESDTDGESFKSPHPKKEENEEIPYDEDDIEIGLSPRSAAAQSTQKQTLAATKQTSWQSSVEDNSWGDSPVTPRKNDKLTHRVSFKRDEELSEVHDITATESDSADTNDQGFGLPKTSTPAKPSSQGGYVPTGAADTQAVSPSHEKMRGDDKKTALMDELGISDVDDISELSESHSHPAPPAVPATPPPQTGETKTNVNDDWDTSAMSDIISTPRPGILKKWNNNNLNSSGEGQPQPKLLIKAPAIDSDDESSAWDTTEGENLVQAVHSGGASTTVVQRKDSVSEWDSDLEDMVTPVTPAAVATPTPPPPPPDAPITKEVEAIVRQKHAEYQDSDEDGSISPVARRPSDPESNKFYVSNNNDLDDDDDDDDWDSTTDAVTPRGNAGLQFKEVNVGGGASVSEPVSDRQCLPPPPPPPATQSHPPQSHTVEDVEDEDTESAWDSDGDALPSDTGNAPLHREEAPGSLIPTAITTPRSAHTEGPANQMGDQGQGSDSDVESESMSSWELERKKKKKRENPLQQSIEDEDEEFEEAYKQSLLLQQREEEENRRRKEEEERREKEEEERKLREESERQEREMLELEREEARREDERQRERLREESRREEERRREREEIEKEEERQREEEERKKESQREEAKREEERIREWEREEKEREEERQRQWEIEESVKREIMKREVEEVMEKEKFETSEKSSNSKNPHLWSSTNGGLSAQEELNRIDEQFQREKEERERKEEEERQKEQEEAAKRRKEEEEKKEAAASVAKSSPSLPVRTHHSSKLSPSGRSDSSGVYVNIGSSTVEQIKQRLQVPPPSMVSPTTGLSGTGPFTAPTEGFDDNDSFMSDLPDEDRPRLPQSYYPGILGSSPGIVYKTPDLVDDDALSYTSTEFEDPMHQAQSSAAYGRDRDVLSNISLNDPSSLLKVQEYVRDTRRQLEQEKNHKLVLENKLKVAGKEKAELNKKLETQTQTKSDLEQSKLDLEAKIRSLEYNVSEEEEKRKNAEILLNKTKDQLSRREEQYASELEAKQRAELTMRNLQIELRSSANTIKELEDEKEELQRQATHANNARLLQEQINEDQQKFMHQQTTQSAQHTPRGQSSIDISGGVSSEEMDIKELDDSAELSGDNDKLRAELYAMKMEVDRQRSRFKDEVTLMGAENEELLAKNEELKNDIRLNEEALAHATMQYNIQVATLRTEISTVTASADRDKAGREKAEAEIESLKTRLVSSNHEMDKVSRVRHELERDHQREKETWVREMERKEDEVNMLKENSQHLNQRLHATDSKFNSIENELHVSQTSLMERTSQLQQQRQDLERQKTSAEQLDHSLKLEKDHNAKLQAKVETMQEKLSHQQHENLSLKQQMDSLKLSGGGLPGSEANEKLNAILTNLRADSERARASLEERNTSLVEQVARLKEEVRSGESRRTQLEQELRRLHEEHSDMVKKLSHAEASLQMTSRSKDQLESERTAMRMELDKLATRHQTAHDKAVEAQARVSELVDRLEKAEHSSLHSSQQLVATSATMQQVNKSKSDLDDSLHQLQVENARLEAELKYEKQRADMLYQDLQDSQKVRSSLEALCANLKTSSAHMEEKLAEPLRKKYGAHIKIADLERNKNLSDSRLGEEKNRISQMSEEKRGLESRLEEEMEKNQQLQKDVNTLKLHLKSAKNKMKGHIGEPGDVRTELEARYRQELNRKLDDVNRFLDTQTALRDRLDTSRTDMESNLLFDRRKLEEENNNLRVKYEQAVSQRETKEMEARRFRELYESEMKWRMRISDQLQIATDKSLNLKSKFNTERMHRNRLTGSIGNLNSSIVSNNSMDPGRHNGYHDDELSSKIKAELDRSIAKHLEAAPHNHNKPHLRPGKDSGTRFTSSLTQASHDYIDLLKRKYCV